MSTADTGTRGSRPGDLPRRRVLLLAESAGLAAVLHHLLDPGDRLSRLGTLRELAETRALENADVVILDVPAEDRVAAVRQVRRRYLGPLVVLVAKGDDTGGLHLDDAATLLTRPFSADALGSALGLFGHPGGVRPGARAAVRLTMPAAERPSAAAADRPAPAATPSPVAAAAVGPGAALSGAGTGTPAAPTTPAAEAAAPPADAAKVLANVKAAARRAPVRAVPATARGQLDLVDRVQRALIALTEGWKARRRVRVAGFSAFALVAFTVAFAMASQGRCGPGCDAFGTVFSPEPTVAPASSRAPSTTGPKRATTTTAGRPASSAATGPFQGISSGGRLAATTTTAQRATTTTRKTSPGAAPTTRPPTTQPPTTPTTSPSTTPTTAPPTTPTPTTGGA